MHVSEINRYPLKSGAADTLDVGALNQTGLNFDRHWMVVSESGMLISQREKGAQKLSLIRAIVADDSVEFFAPDKPSLVVPMKSPDNRRMSVTVHDNQLEGIDAGDSAAKWISDFLPPWKGEKFRIVYFPSDYERKTTDAYTNQETATTEFADGYAVLIANSASLDDLNRRLTERGVDTVSMSVFRPNIVVAGAEPWEEDLLRRISIGDTVLEVVKPCARCPITGVTQEVGRFSAKPLEPRATLKDFHAGKDLITEFPNLGSDLLDQPMFAQNAIVIKPGTIRLNDEVTVISRR